MSYLASLDQSTTSTKFSIYTKRGEMVAKQIIEHKQICAKEGLLEHDPLQIITNTQLCISRVISKMKENPSFNVKQIIGLGVTNQRQTVICWDKAGKPYYNAIVWCDTRCKDICQQFKAKHGEFKAKTGLPVSTYFSLFKILWLIKNVPEIKQAIAEDNISFGTIDTWVIYNLTGTFVTDASNASRTYLCNLKGEWDQQLISIAGIRRQQLATIVDSFGSIARVNTGELDGVQIRSILGDQQSSAYAHQLMENQIKITYGTGCFLLANIGDKPIINQSFITTILYKYNGVIQYAFQCSVQCGAGTLNWAKRAGFFKQYQQLNHYQDVTGQELYFFPSFGQIYAPFWKSNVKGGILGLNLSTTQPQIIGSLLQSILFRIKDNLKSSIFDKVVNIYADGGMTVNKKLMQSQSNILNKNIIVRERDTVWGVAKGVLTSYEQSPQDFKDQHVHSYFPEHSSKLQQKYERWCSERHKFYNW